MVEAAAKYETVGVEFDEELYKRFILWKDQSGKSVGAIAGMLARSTAAVSQYINKKYPGDVAALERHIGTLLKREEDLQFVNAPKSFCATSCSKLIWEVLQYCDEGRKMGAAVAPSGTGKTETCREYKRQNRATIFVTMDITRRYPSAVLRTVAKQSGMTRNTTIMDMLDGLVDRLKGSNRLIIIDDAHFLTWESFELVRKIHDCAGVGIVTVGQERLYEQMKGKDLKGYLYDQIYSRIAIKRDRFQIKKSDVKMMAQGMLPGLDEPCMDYLYEIARGKGRFRRMANLLEVAAKSREQYGYKLDLGLLAGAEKLLMGE